MADVQKKFDDTFKALKDTKQNNVNNLMQWLKDAKIVDQSKAAEEKAMKLLSEAEDKSNVQADHFKKVITTLATENKVKADDLLSKLTTEGDKFVASIKSTVAAAVDAGASALKDALTPK